MSNPDKSTNLIGALAPLGVVLAWALKASGVDVPAEVQAAIAALLFTAACHFIGKPSALSRRNRTMLDGYLSDEQTERSQ